MPLESQLLLIDADDTLWENNVYFERAIDRFIAMLAHTGQTRAQILEHINREERRCIHECGYGLKSFSRALTYAYEAVERRAPNAAVTRQIQDLAVQIHNEPIELLPGIPETLWYLAGRHRLVMFTKGDFAEQNRKVELSGLKALFESVEVVPEKNEGQYRRMIEAAGAPSGRNWMIGNSPKSDINPALAAGLHAVFIPHPMTWVLEHTEIVTHPLQRLLQLERFSDLRMHF